VDLGKIQGVKDGYGKEGAALLILNLINGLQSFFNPFFFPLGDGQNFKLGFPRKLNFY